MNQSSTFTDIHYKSSKFPQSDSKSDFNCYVSHIDCNQRGKQSKYSCGTFTSFKKVEEEKKSHFVVVVAVDIVVVVVVLLLLSLLLLLLLFTNFKVETCCFRQASRFQLFSREPFNYEARDWLLIDDYLHPSHPLFPVLQFWKQFPMLFGNLVMWKQKHRAL